MKEIKELDMNKYLVIKREDLEKFFSPFTKGIFSTNEEMEAIAKVPFSTVLRAIQIDRAAQGKKDGKYLVLNLDDEIDAEYISDMVQKRENQSWDIHHEHKSTVRVKDIAVDLVNAILRAKQG